MDWQPVWGVPRLSPCGSLDRLHPPTTLMRIIGGDGWILGQRKALLSLLGLGLLLPQVTWQKQQLVEETVLTADRSMFFCTKWVAFHQVSVDSVYIVFCACGLSRETKTFIVERCWHCIPQMSHFRYYQVHRLLHYWLIHGSRNQGSRLVSVTFGAVYTVLQIQANVCIMVLHSLLWIFLTWSVYYDLHPE